MTSPTEKPSRLMVSESPQRAIVAEFHQNAGGRLTLFAMTVEGDSYRKTYDVEHSRRYGYLFHCSGSGGSGPVPVSGAYFVSGNLDVREEPTQLVHAGDRPPWRSSETSAIRERNRTRRLDRLPKSFDLEPGMDLLGWLRRNAIEQDAVWCAECRDWNRGDELCKHMWWCDEVGWYAPGCSPCKKCIDGHCRDRFNLTPHVHAFDQGPLWFWSQAPELECR